jgi:hypothetical protein
VVQAVEALDPGHMCTEYWWVMVFLGGV